MEAQKRSLTEFEQLEDRITPLVGQAVSNAPLPAFAPAGTKQFTAADLVGPGTIYDTVVSITSPIGYGTGTLIKTGDGQGYGHHILTVAHHTDPSKVTNVSFTLPRSGYAQGVPVTIPVPAGKQIQVKHNDWVFGAHSSDIAIIRLADPKGQASPSRLLVAPYSSQAQPFEVYNQADEIPLQPPGKTVTIVGYGVTGAGRELQLPTGLPAPPDKQKRVGQNTIDMDGTAPWEANKALNKEKLLLIDFDNGKAANDFTGKAYGAAASHTGLKNGNNPMDAMIGPGDSGGPWFYDGKVIGMSVQRGTSGVGADAVLGENSSFGEYGTGLRLSQFRDDFINKIVSNGANYKGTTLENPVSSAYDLVLDMEYQAYGQSNPVGQTVDNLKIEVMNVGGFLEIHVNGLGASADAKIGGLYYRAPAANIKSLTIRGTNDNEAIVIRGNLGLRVEVDGGGGTDTIFVDHSQSLDIASKYTIDASEEAGWTAISHLGKGAGFGLAGVWGFRPTTYITNVESYTLSTGLGEDTVKIYSTPTTAGFTGIEVQTNGSDDTIIVGSPTKGLSQVTSKLVLNAGGDANDTIRFDDSAATKDGYEYTFQVPAANVYKLDRSVPGVGQMPGIETANASRYELLTGAGKDVVTLVGAPAMAKNEVVVRAGDGDDHIVVASAKGLDPVLALIRVDGGLGNNTLTVNNRGGSVKDMDLTKTTITRSDGKTIAFSGVKTLQTHVENGAKVNEKEKDLGFEHKIGLLGGNNSVTTGPGQLAFELGGDPNWITITRDDPAPIPPGDQLTLAGTLAVALTPTFAATLGQVFTIIDNQTALSIIGTFYKRDESETLVALPEGDIISVGGWEFAISYIGNESPSDVYENDVTLTVTAVPSSSSNTSSVAGVAWIDADGNGLNDDGQVAQGIGVSLIDADGNVIQTLTNSQGEYLFSDLEAGTYTVSFDRADYRFTILGGDSDAEPTTGLTAPFTLDDSQTLTGIDAGLVNNSAPVGADDEYTAMRDDTLSVVASGVLVNDDDAESDPISAVLEVGPEHGTLIFNSDGSFEYTPDEDFAGTDTFSYRPVDEFGLGEPVSVRITVVNDPPGAEDDTATTNEDDDVNIPVLANDSEPDSDDFAIDSFTDGSYGTVALDDNGTEEDPTDDFLVYTPNPDWNGTDVFTYWLIDEFGGLSEAIVTVTVNPVNDAPVAVDDTFTAHKNTDLVGNVLPNDSDANSDPLTVTLGTDVLHGSLTLNADGSFTYTPSLDYYGDDTFTYSIDDGSGGTDTATVTITVADTSPPVGVNDSYTLTEGELSVAATGVLANDTNPNNGTLTAVLVSGPSNGTLTLNTDGSFVYIPNDDFVGTDSFTYKPSDSDGSGTAATVSINVTDHPPVAVDDTASVDEDNLAGVTISVLSNDTDADDDTLTIVGASDGNFGTAVVNPNGTITYTPDANASGTDTFYYMIDDGHGRFSTAKVTITVNPVSDDPDAVDDTAGIEPDTATEIDVLANDSDADGDELTITSVTQGSHGSVTWSGGVVTYTPAPSYTGTDSFTYTISDGNGGTDTATVEIRVDNHDPIASNDSASVHGLSNNASSPPLNASVSGNVVSLASDPDGDTLTASLHTGPSHGTVTVAKNGAYTYTPDQGYTGSDSFEFQVDDGFGGTAIGTISITVTNTNPAGGDDSVATVNSSAKDVHVLANDTDPDGDPLIITSFTQGSHGAVAKNDNGTPDDPTDDYLVYTPTAGYVGPDSFTYTVDDGLGGTDTVTVTVSVTAPPPRVWVTPAVLHVTEGGIGTFSFKRTGNLSSSLDLTLATSSISGYFFPTPGVDLSAFSVSGGTIGTPDMTFHVLFAANSDEVAISFNLFTDGIAENEAASFTIITAPSGYTIDPLANKIEFYFHDA